MPLTEIDDDRDYRYGSADAARQRDIDRRRVTALDPEGVVVRSRTGRRPLDWEPMPRRTETPTTPTTTIIDDDPREDTDDTTTDDAIDLLTLELGL